MRAEALAGHGNNIATSLGRIIIHCDLDAFFASVETLHHGLDPKIPLIIGSDPKGGRARGIVSTCNYAARKYGIHSAMPISEAWRRCPGHPIGIGLYMKSTRGLISRASRKVMEILQAKADKFEQTSVDEAFLDVTTVTEGDWDKALALAKSLQNEIMNNVSLGSSFGIGPTRIIAKMSSEENKPMGIHRVMPDEIEHFFNGRKCREVPGIGPKSATRLAEWGIETVDDAYELGEIGLTRFSSERFAKWIIHIYEGTSSSEVSVLRSRKSISKEHTFPTDITDSEEILSRLKLLIGRVCKRVREMEIAGRLCEVKIRYKGFETHTYGKSLMVAMDDEKIFRRVACELFATNIDLERPVRLIGFKIGGLEAPPNRQSTLDDVGEESE
ncbi:MAG: DNA polymerase IV [Euryarchaeota archaeon]|jgi:DNA polymerase IV (DinB-like DNA polymerase)|nr:DNA polymerase IV [Euryarchaeota archaeon]MBT3971315.1 DNA polymerase IV [Euryarchaeota archaeon]